MKGLIWKISEYRHLTRCETCFERAICSQKYRYCVILTLIYYYLCKFVYFLKNWKVLNTIIGDIVIIKVSADNVICERPLMKFGIYCRKRY